jgi:hypothetical protein
VRHACGLRGSECSHGSQAGFPPALSHEVNTGHAAASLVAQVPSSVLPFGAITVWLVVACYVGCLMWRCVDVVGRDPTPGHSRRKPEASVNYSGGASITCAELLCLAQRVQLCPEIDGSAPLILPARACCSISSAARECMHELCTTTHHCLRLRCTCRRAAGLCWVLSCAARIGQSRCTLWAGACTLNVCCVVLVWRAVKVSTGLKLPLIGR